MEENDFTKTFLQHYNELDQVYRKRLAHFKYLPSSLTYFFLTLLGLLLLFPRLIWYVFFISVAGIVGFLVSQNSDNKMDDIIAKMAEKGIDAFTAGGSLKKMAEMDETTQRLFEFSTTRFGRTKESPVLYRAGIAVNIDCALNYFLDFMTRDFINSWYRNLNHSESPQFADQVRTSMNIVFHRLNYLTRSSSFVGLTMLLSQTVVLHLREYRKFEVTGVPFATYIEANAQSPLALAVTKPQLLKNLRSISHHMVQHLVPKEDVSSPLTFSLLVELVASCVLEPIVELLSDPDWINQMIIKKLSVDTGDTANLNVAVGASSPRAPTSLVDRSRSRVSRAEKSHKKMHLRIIEGRHFKYLGKVSGVVLPASTSFYCSVMCGHERASSKKIRGEANPMWMQEWQFSMDRIDSLENSKTRGYVDGIVVDVYESRTLSLSDKLLGSVYVQLAGLKPNAAHKGWYNIERTSPATGKNMQSSMQLLLECRLEESSLQSSTSHKANMDDPSATTHGDDTEPDREAIRQLPVSTLHGDGTLLIQFMQYMDDQNADNLLKFFLNLETFQLYASDPAVTKDIQRKDALDHYEHYFNKSSKSNILKYIPDSALNLVEALPKQIEQSISAFVFSQVAQVIAKVFERDYWEPFKQSSLFLDWWDDARAQYLTSSDNVLAETTEEKPELPAGLVDRTVDQIQAYYALKDTDKSVPLDWELTSNVRRRGLATISSNAEAHRRRCISETTLLMLPDIQRERLAATDDNERDGDAVLRSSGLVRVDFNREREAVRQARTARNFKKKVEDAQLEQGGMHFLNSQLTNLREQANILDDVLEQRKEVVAAANLHADGVLLAGGSVVNPVGASPVHPSLLIRANMVGPKHLSSGQLRKMRADLAAQIFQIEKMLREMAEEQDHIQAANQTPQGDIESGTSSSLAISASTSSLSVLPENISTSANSLVNINLHDVQVEVIETGNYQPVTTTTSSLSLDGRHSTSSSGSNDRSSFDVDNVGRSKSSHYEALFLIQIMSTRTGKGWVKQKSFSQFCALHETLRQQFPKVDKIPFPLSGMISKIKGTSAQLSPTNISAPIISGAASLFSMTNKAVKGFGKVVDAIISGDDVSVSRPRDFNDEQIVPPRNILGANQDKLLTSYLTMLCMDMVLAESRDLKQFLRPDSQSANGLKSEPTSPTLLDYQERQHSIDMGEYRPLEMSKSTPSSPNALPPPRNSSMNSASNLKPLQPSAIKISTNTEERPETEASAANIPSPPSAVSGPQVADLLSPDDGIFVDASVPETKSKESDLKTKINLDDADIDILLECGFSLIEEIFGLSANSDSSDSSSSDGVLAPNASIIPNFVSSNNWLRLKGLTLIKQIVRRTHGTAISNLVIDKLSEFTCDSSITKLIDWLTGTLWPGDGKQLVKRIPPRPLDIQERDKLLAKQLWLKSVQRGGFNSDFAAKFLGQYNTMVGMTRLFNMLQIREVNRHLAIVVLERIIRTILLQNSTFK